MGELEASNDALKAEVAGLKAELGQMQDQLDHADTNVANLQHEINDKRAVIDRMAPVCVQVGVWFGAFTTGSPEQAEKFALARAWQTYLSTIAPPSPIDAGFAAVRERRKGEPMTEGMEETLRVAMEAAVKAVGERPNA